MKRPYLGLGLGWHSLGGINLQVNSTKRRRFGEGGRLLNLRSQRVRLMGWRVVGRVGLGLRRVREGRGSY